MASGYGMYQIRPLMCLKQDNKDRCISPQPSGQEWCVWLGDHEVVVVMISGICHLLLEAPNILVILLSI